jgi:hypothetical protein
MTSCQPEGVKIFTRESDRVYVFIRNVFDRDIVLHARSACVL